MVNKNADTNALMDSLTDYANAHGDQELISLIDVWLLKKMKTRMAIRNVEKLDAIKQFAYKTEILSEVNQEILKLSSPEKDKLYQQAIVDVMLIIVNKMLKGFDAIHA